MQLKTFREYMNEANDEKVIYVKGEVVAAPAK